MKLRDVPSERSYTQLLMKLAWQERLGVIIKMYEAKVTETRPVINLQKGHYVLWD